VLSGLWLASVFLFGGGAVFVALRGELPAPFGALAAALCTFLAVLSVAMAYGVWMLKPWARLLQIAIAAIGLLNCPMTLASATVLVYMLRKPTALWFSGRDLGRRSSEEAAALDLSSETAFALAVLAMTALGVLLTAGGAWLGWGRL
jgi:hypothetical protein